MQVEQNRQSDKKKTAATMTKYLVTLLVLLGLALPGKLKAYTIVCRVEFLPMDSSTLTSPFSSGPGLLLRHQPRQRGRPVGGLGQAVLGGGGGVQDRLVRRRGQPGLLQSQIW